VRGAVGGRRRGGTKGKEAKESDSGLHDAMDENAKKGARDENSKAKRMRREEEEEVNTRMVRACPL
jgi:hypothetical protein